VIGGHVVRGLVATRTLVVEQHCHARRIDPGLPHSIDLVGDVERVFDRFEYCAVGAQIEQRPQQHVPARTHPAVDCQYVHGTDSGGDE